MEYIKQYPFVSICTPTFNRRHFFPVLFEMFKLQTYPRNRMEWIILDDGTDKVRDVIEQSGISQIQYYEVDKKMHLGAKRNKIHTYCKGSIIIYVDDDDYFPPERVEHSVYSLLSAKNGELIAGSSEIYLYFREKGLYQFGPYGANHATAGTFAFKKELLKLTQYDDNACLAEESHFLKNYSFPVIQLDPVKTILVFPHGHNSFDKHTLLDNEMGGPIQSCKNKTIDDFIYGINAAYIKDFFLHKIHSLLKNYTSGEPHMKPDVQLQTRQIQIQRNILELQAAQHAQHAQHVQHAQQKSAAAAAQPYQIMCVQPNGTITPLTNEQIIQLLKEKDNQIHQLTEKIKYLETIAATAEKKLI